MWLVIAITFGIYFWAGKEIYQKSRQLRDFSAHRPPPYPAIDNPFVAPAVSTKTTEIHVSSELAELPRRTSSQVSLKEAASRGRSKPNGGYDQYSVTIETNPVTSPSQERQPTPSRNVTRSEQVQKQRSAASEAHRAAIGYCKTALLFFVALLITWVCLCPAPSASNILTFPSGTIDNQPRVLIGASRGRLFWPQLRFRLRATTSRVLERRRIHIYQSGCLRPTL